MKSFLDALSFLTIIRLPRKEGVYNAHGSLKAFVFVGIFIGFCLAFIGYMMDGRSSTPIVMLLFLTVITGGLHLDGLADTADGLFSHRPRAQKLEIMKDSRTGAMGVIAVVLLLLSKYHSLGMVTDLRIFVLVPAYSRLSMLAGIYFLPYAREKGTGKAFFGEMNPLVFLTAAIPVAISFSFAYTFENWLSVFLTLNIGYAVVVGLILWGYKKAIGGITGDMLGALCEVTEAAMFLLASEMMFDAV